jgi:hypothetical protein
MLVPLLFGVFGYLYYWKQEEQPRVMVLTEQFFGVLILLTAAATGAVFFIDLPIHAVQKYATATGLLIAFSVIATAFWKQRANRLLWVVIFILVLRIGFDLLVLPTRHAESEETQSKETARELVELSSDGVLKFWWNPDYEPEPYYGYRICTYRFNYYLVLHSESVVYVTDEKDTEHYFISKLGMIQGQDVEILKTFRPPGQPSDLVLFRFLPGSVSQLNR